MTDPDDSPNRFWEIFGLLPDVVRTFLVKNLQYAWWLVRTKSSRYGKAWWMSEHGEMVQWFSRWIVGLWVRVRAAVMNFFFTHQPRDRNVWFRCRWSIIYHMQGISYYLGCNYVHTGGCLIVVWGGLSEISHFRGLVAQSGKIQGFLRPDGQSEQKLTIWANACCNPNILGEIFEFLSVHISQIFRNFHLALPAIFRGPVWGGAGEQGYESGLKIIWIQLACTWNTQNAKRTNETNEHKMQNGQTKKTYIDIHEIPQQRMHMGGDRGGRSKQRRIKKRDRNRK